jgi:Ran GTPase-activating protein (RanGAP) involved in mRNA processing and transport
MLNHLPLTFWKQCVFCSQDLKNISGVCSGTYKIILFLRQSKDFSFTSRIIKIPTEFIYSTNLNTILYRFIQKWNLPNFISVNHIVYFSSGKAEEVHRMYTVIPKEFFISINFTGRQSKDYNNLLIKTFKSFDHRLISLNLQDNDLTMSSAKSMIECLYHTPFLKELNISNNRFIPTDFVQLASALCMLDKLTNLNISDNIFTVAATKALIPAFNSMTSLLKLDISKTNIGHISLDILSKNIVNMTKLESLNISYNCTGTESAHDWALILQRLPSLKEFDMSFTETGVDKLIVLSPIICNLKSLNICGNQIGEYFETQNSDLKMPNLEFLNISLNNIKDKGVPRFSKSLETMTSLTNLSLKNNQIETEGCVILSSCIKNMKKLTTLDIGYLDCDLTILILSLSYLPSLTYLDMSCNEKMSDVNALTGLSNLVYLNISDNNLGEEGATELSLPLSKMSRLTSLDLSSNLIYDNGLISLVETLSSLIYLQDIKLSYNGIKNKGVIALGNHFQLLTSLQTLNLLKNKISKDGFTFLKSKLSTNNIIM